MITNDDTDYTSWRERVRQHPPPETVPEGDIECGNCHCMVAEVIVVPDFDSVGVCAMCAYWLEPEHRA